MTEPQPAIRLTGLTKEFGAVTAVDHVDLEIAAGEFFSMLGPVGLGQDHGAAAHRRLRAADERHDRALRAGRHQARALRPRREHGLPGLRALPAHERARQRRLRAAGARHRPQGARPSGRCARSPRCGSSRFGDRKPSQLSGGQRQRVALARATVVAAQGAAARRAARRARPQAPRADAGRAEADPARARHHLHLRHARPGGGAHPLRPHRRVQRRPHRAARHARASSTSSRHRASSPTSSAPRTSSTTTRSQQLLGRDGAALGAPREADRSPRGRRRGRRRALTRRARSSSRSTSAAASGSSSTSTPARA